MGSRHPILNALGIPRHADCKNCGDPVAQNPENGRWSAFAVLRPSGQTGHQNADGSANIDGTACNDSKTGKHQAEPGSIW